MCVCRLLHGWCPREVLELDFDEATLDNAIYLACGRTQAAAYSVSLSTSARQIDRIVEGGFVKIKLKNFSWAPPMQEAAHAHRQTRLLSSSEPAKCRFRGSPGTSPTNQFVL